MANAQRPAGGRSLYPWDRWFGKQWFRASRGRDYVGRTDTFVQQIRNAARARNINVRVRVLRGPDGEEDITVTVGHAAGPANQVLKGEGQ